MARYLGLGKETTYGTAVAPATYLRILSESLEFNPNFVYHRTIEGGRGVQTVQSVRQMMAGSIRFMPVYDKGLGEILHMLAGKVTTTVSEAAIRWQHVFEPLVTLGAGTPPAYSIEKGLDDITATRYPGCTVTKLRIAANAADFVMLDASVEGKKFTNPALATAAFSTQDYINAGQVVTQTLGGATVKFEQFSVDIDGGIFLVFKPGSKEPDSIDLSPLMVKTNFVTRFTTAADLTDFLNATQKALVYKWQGPALGTGNYSLQLDLPKLNPDTGDMKVDQQERLLQARGWTAIDDVTTRLFKFTLLNNVSAY